MNALNSPLPEMPITELRFLDSAQPKTDSEARAQTLARQAFVLEFAANSMSASYSPNEMREDLWISRFAPLLVEYHQGLIPEEHAAVAEARIVMAQEFNSRIAENRISNIDRSGLLWGLLAFEDPAITSIVADTLAALHETTDPREVPGYIAAGKNASAFILRNLPGLEGDAVLKIGHPLLHEASGCDQSSYTNMHRWLGLMAGKAVAGFEQPVAFSAEQPISITEFVPGMELHEIGKPELKIKPQPSEDTLQKFADSFYEAIVRGITIDISGRDILYEPDTDALTIIDHSQFSRAYSRVPGNYIETVDALVATFKASFGDEFDGPSFSSLLHEFASQGLYDLKALRHN